MNDSWNVKSVRRSYQSCMKINGEPLLPPVLSNECRREMQYYKMLAKEVEKRISLLTPYVAGDTNETDHEDEDITDIPSASECDYIYGVSPQEKFERSHSKSPERSLRTKRKELESVKVKTDPHSRNFCIDLSLRINHTENEDTLAECSSVSSESQASLLPIELPERDCDSRKIAKQKEIETELLNELIKDYNSSKQKNSLLMDLNKTVCSEIDTIHAASEPKKELMKETINFSFDLNKDSLSDAFLDLALNEGPSSASNKSFTGSLLDIHSESAKDTEFVPKLVRQRSYTVLTPSPQLMAHLEITSQNKGVAVTSISMSESVSNAHKTHKKRRSWDLETAKKKWSSMALELKESNVANGKVNNVAVNDHQETAKSKRMNHASPIRAQSVSQDRRQCNLNNKNLTKSDPIQKPTNAQSLKYAPSDRTITKESLSPTNRAMRKDHCPKLNQPKTESPKHVIGVFSELEDPALKIRDLYEKIKKQQQIQMTSLIEKQKKEQLFLQQVFEEQNTILFKQLKMICPKSPIEIRQAWGDKKQEGDKGSGPVSLSQLNHIPKALGSVPSSPVSKTLTDTNQYINQCDDVLKRSRDITSNMKKQQAIKRPLTNGNNSNKRSASPTSRNRSRSPNNRNTSRKLNYESASDYEPMLTDRTNDTLADINVTFPSDSEDISLPKYGSLESSKEITVLTRSQADFIKVDTAIKHLESSIHNSMNTMCARALPACPQTTPEKRAAASKIVAYARGYLVRRLMRTERIQATVQTIRDALLCALQLHQDREGIRGADVDLHRRLIQQITAACYSLHDAFISSTPQERCALIAADRARRRVALARNSPNPRMFRQTDVMSRSHTGVFPSRSKRPSSAASIMTQSNYETFSGATTSNRRRPWR